jgi:hypothetical protein
MSVANLLTEAIIFVKVFFRPSFFSRPGCIIDILEFLPGKDGSSRNIPDQLNLSPNRSFDTVSWGRTAEWAAR